jgi:hypothetical protein
LKQLKEDLRLQGNLKDFSFKKNPRELVTMQKGLLGANVSHWMNAISEKLK